MERPVIHEQSVSPALSRALAPDRARLAMENAVIRNTRSFAVTDLMLAVRTLPAELPTRSFGTFLYEFSLT